MFTLNDIKTQYYQDKLAGIEFREFAQYLTEEYTHVYDSELNFVGYERNN